MALLERRIAARRRDRAPVRAPGFTLIELLVVLAILALLLTIASPRYIQHVERAKETTLRTSLKVMREAIDKFEGDQGRLPSSLQELADRDYLKTVPLDPMTDRSDTWVTVNAADAAAARRIDSPGIAPGLPLPAGGRPDGGIADVHSGAAGNGSDGTAFHDW